MEAVYKVCMILTPWPWKAQKMGANEQSQIMSQTKSSFIQNIEKKAFLFYGLARKPQFSG